MNKNTDTEEYLKKLQGVKLSESSRARIENNLLEYARFHTVRVDGVGRSIERVPQHTSFITQVLINLNKKSMIAAFIAIMLLVGGGTSYAAENSLPGDALYPIKVNVNEKVESALAVSNESEAKLQAELAAKRLGEAETLASEGRLTADAAADLSARLKAHYDDAEARSKTAESEGDYQSAAMVHASLDGNLHTYATILADLNTRVSGNSGDALISEVRTYAAAAAHAQTIATATISVNTKDSVSGTIADADMVIAEAKVRAEDAGDALSAKAHGQVNAKIDEAASAEAQAKASFTATSYQTAYASAQAAIRIASEVKTMINSAIKLNVKNGVTTGGILNSVLDIHQNNSTDTKESSDAESNTTVGSTSDNSTDTPSSNNIDANVHTDTKIDTEVIDTDVHTDTSVKGTSGLGL